MRIMANNTGLSCCDKFYAFWAILSLIITLAGAVMGVLSHVNRDMNMLAPGFALVPIFYFNLVIFSCCMPATRYLCNLVEQPKLKAKIELAIESEPDINYYIQCYHYEWREVTRTDRDADGNETYRTERVRERVNTHYAEKHFKIKKWEDRSPPASTLDFLSVLLLSRLSTEKEIKYSTKAWHRFEKKKKKFIKKNRRDKYYDYHHTEVINFMQKECLVYSPKQGEKPWFTNVCLMVFLDFIMLGWIPRYHLAKNTKIVDYEIIKYIHN